MPNLAIVGYGKMGRLIDQLAPEYGFTVTARVDVDRDESLDGADVAVEFSVPSAVLGNIRKVAALGIPIVIGTTGWLEHLAEAKSHRSKPTTALWSGARISRSASTSSRAWSREAARLLANEKEYGAWAWEIHHITKKDAPSGTLIQAGGSDEGRGLRAQHRHQFQPRRRASRARTRSASIPPPTPSRCATPRAAGKASPGAL